MISPRIELGTFCVLSRCHNRLDHETVYGQVRSRTEDLSHAKGARYQLRHMPIYLIMKWVINEVFRLLKTSPVMDISSKNLTLYSRVAIVRNLFLFYFNMLVGSNPEYLFDYIVLLIIFFYTICVLVGIITPVKLQDILKSLLKFQYFFKCYFLFIRVVNIK